MNTKLELLLSLAPATSGCWEWEGKRNGGGYGYFYDPQTKKIELAHRRAWEIENGPIPAGASILHSCDNPACCNPAHLRTGTAKENAQDTKDHGRAEPWYRSRNVGEAHPLARLTAQDVEGIKAMRAAGATYKAIGQRFGISLQQAQKICTGKTWVKHGPRSAVARGVPA